ncbi:MAG: single-stranded DNA-binding protein [Christensenellaceae bacterium]|jgi:single-strand DNA-binding protein|nr:single-stranded DNA-binding protein [Christensenellaceae bacterium]
MNKIFLIGRLTRDPELTTLQTGSKCCKFSIAVDRRYKETDGSRATDFFPVTVWGKAAENSAQYLKKGRQVSVVGSLQTRNYDANDGTKRFAIEVSADDVEFIGSKSADDSEATHYEPSNTTSTPPLGLQAIAVSDNSLPF